MDIAEEIKSKREQQGLSQEELAEQVGVSRQAVSKWESGLAEPTGKNRRELLRILQLEDAAEAKMPKKLKAAMVAGWVLAGALAVALVCCICVLRQTPKTSEALEAGGTTEILSVHFYDGDQQEVLPEALWYDTAKIECILVQWTGETPQTVRLFYTPAGSETIEKTELLVTVAPLDGENAALISALALHRDDIYGHAYIQLDGGDESDLFNVGYDLAA